MPERDPADPHIVKSSDEERPRKVSFAVDGMTCQSCVDAVEAALMKREGIKDVKADLTSALVTVEFDSRKIEEAAIHELILSTGYKPAGLMP